MDHWRVNDWRSSRAAARNPDEERRVATADDDEDRSIRRFKAATEPLRPGELPLLRPLVVSPPWILAISAVVVALSLVWLQLAMMGVNSPLF
jgi:hypothetical protein